jgi:hypothetical protein
MRGDRLRHVRPVVVTTAPARRRRALKHVALRTGLVVIVAGLAVQIVELWTGAPPPRWALTTDIVMAIGFAVTQLWPDPGGWR